MEHPWKEAVERQDWLEAAKLAAVDPAAQIGTSVTFAVIAIAEALCAKPEPVQP